MGNEISKKYNLKEEHNATAGFNGLWKIYPGHVTNKDKVTTTDISVWIFMRDGLAKREPVPITDKSAQEQLMQIMKKDMSAMKEKEMQHRGIVRVLEVNFDVKDHKQCMYIIVATFNFLYSTHSHFISLPTATIPYYTCRCRKTAARAWLL
jgi:hypothetical protein